MKSYSYSDTQRYIFSSGSPDFLGSGLELEIKSTNNKGKNTYRKKNIANFLPTVISKIELDDHGVKTLQVELLLKFVDGSESTPVCLPLKELEKVDWSNDIDIRCILNPSVSKVKHHIANVIRIQYGDNVLPLKTVALVDQIGCYCIDDTHVFHAGNQLIWPSNLNPEERPSVDFQPTPNMTLAIDANCTEKDADTAMAKIVNLSPDSGNAILALNLLSLQWDAFNDAGATPRCNMYLYGRTGFRKTTYAAFTTQLYNRDKPLKRPERLNASIPAAVQMMQKVRYGVLVLDDLYPADDPEIRHQQEKTLLEMVRVIADGTEPARVRGGKVKKNTPRCCILGTGEYYIGDGSDAARLFPIEIKSPIDSELFTACQMEPLMLSTFYRFYIEWFITNYSDAVEILKTWKSSYLQQSKHIAGHDRLKETKFCLEAAYKLYLSYRIEKGFIDDEGASVLASNFEEQLSSILAMQNESVMRGKLTSPEQRTNYVSLISQLFRDNRLLLVDRPEYFELDVHDGVIHKDYLYLRPTNLLAKIRIYEPSATPNELVLDLKFRQALDAGKKSTKQLYGAGNGARFYCIKLSKLNQYR